MRSVRLVILQLAVCWGALAASYLGLGVADRTGGVEVIRVQEGSPAAIAGIQTGDVLLSYNGETIAGGQQVSRLVEDTPVGVHVKIQFSRLGKAHTADIVTASRPVAVNQENWPQFQIPADIPSPLLIWKNNVFGFESETLDGQLAGYFGAPGGLLVRSVETGSPAEISGLRAGDIIVAADDRALSSSRDLSSLLRIAPGKAIRLKIIRDHKRSSLSLTLPD